MSGRGRPGGGLVQHHDPEDVQVTLSLRTTTSSPTFPLDESSGKDARLPPFYIFIHASIKSSTHPTLPVTLSTWRTPLERPFRRALSNSNDNSAEESVEEAGSVLPSPAWLHSALTPLRSTTNPSKIAGPPSLWHIAHHRGGFARDLRESWDFVTVPPASTDEPGEVKSELVIRHLLPREGLNFISKTGEGGDVKPERGEKFVVGPSATGLGTFWSRWGDLRGDLAGKKFRADEWWGGDGDVEGGQGEWIESEGRNGFGLTMEVENEAEIEFV